MATLRVPHPNPNPKTEVLPVPTQKPVFTSPPRLFEAVQMKVIASWRKGVTQCRLWKTLASP